MAETRELALLADVPLFADVRRDTLEALAARLRRRRFRRGDRLMQQDEPAHVLYVLTAGSVKVSRMTEDGDELVLGLAGAGACIGEVAVLDGGPRSATVTALEPTEALALDRDQLLTALQQDPQLALTLIATLARRLRSADARLEDAYFSDLGTRLARRLLQIIEEHGHATSSGIEAPLPLTQAELASMLGAGRSRVNGLLGSFQDAGLIRLGRGTFTVLDPAGLQHRAGR
jgi:CRP/FNR family cyclic AMP-dependent transcriptional regulator